MYRSLATALIVTLCLVGVTQTPVLSQGSQGFNVLAEVRSALDAIEKAHAGIGGMGGLGVIPEDDLAVIQGMLGEAENLVREARRRVQGDAISDQDGAWAVGYARAAKAMAEAADEYRVGKGYM